MGSVGKVHFSVNCFSFRILVAFSIFINICLSSADNLSANPFHDSISLVEI
jgi:hypothetical protein